MGETSLVEGWLPWTIIVLAPVTVVLGLAWQRGRWRAQLVWGVGVATVAVGGVAAVNRAVDAFPYSFPASFYLLAALVVFAGTAAVVGSTVGPTWRRIDSVVSVVACVALVGVVVNGHYDYYPTLANAFGEVTANEVDLPEVASMQAQVRSSGRLPEKGAIVHVPIPGTTSGFRARDGYVYLPPAYFADPQPKLPVLMLIHGVPGEPSDWLVGGQAASVLDDFAADHDGKSPVVVMPDATGSDFNDTECVDGGHGQVETYLTADVPAYVEATFATATGHQTWGVAGLSMGGYCALVLPLRHPDLFAVFGDYSGLAAPELDPPASALTDLFGGDQQTMDSYDPTKILASERFPQLAGWFEVGLQDDAPLQATRAVAAEASRAGITTCQLYRDGGHDFAFWHQALVDSLPWMSSRLHLVDPPVDTAGATCTGS